VTATEVGFLDSLAWREDGQLRVVLHLPDLQTTSVEVRFRDGERRVRRPGIVSSADPGTLVEVDTDAAQLADGLWRIAVRPDGAEAFTRVRARLLVRSDLPVALLPGPDPDVRLPEPPPRRLTSSPPARVYAFARRVVGGVRRRLGR
jgi:hypothetical protein